MPIVRFVRYDPSTGAVLGMGATKRPEAYTDVPGVLLDPDLSDVAHIPENDCGVPNHQRCKVLDGRVVEDPDPTRALAALEWQLGIAARAAVLDEGKLAQMRSALARARGAATAADAIEALREHLHPGS